MAVRSLKLSYNGEIRRFSLESLQIVEGHVSLDDLKQAARKTFSELKEMEFTLSYQDEDHDIITISTDSEVSEAFSVTKSLNSKVLRLEVAATKNSPSNKAVHFRIICDGCGANPIIGDRFKCSVRDDYDLCAQCEALDNSLYPFLKIKTPAQSPAAIMTILKPNQTSRSVSETSSIVSDAMIEKINQTEDLYNDQVVDMNEEPVVKKDKKQKPVGSCPMPSLVRLECLSSIREFGPFYAMRKPNNCMIFLDPSSEKAIKSERPWKSGKCLRLDNKTNGILMDGNGGPWASFHVENVKDASGGGGPSDVIRLVCGNRRLVLCATGGKLGCCSSIDRGHHTHFKLHEASNVDEVDPIWDAMSVASSENAAAASPWDVVTPEEEKPFWEGLSESLINDVKAQMEQHEESVVPPQLPVVLQASFVKDMTIPDGQNMQTGESFVKVWRLRNDTDVAFPKGVKLVHAGGAEMGQMSQVALNKEPIHPFEEFEVAVPMNAPSNPGKYASFWRLEFNGEKFGHQVWVEIMVVESPEKLMKAAQEEAEKLALAKMKAEQDEKESRILQEAARAQAEEALAVEAARMQAAEDSRIQAEEEARKQAEEVARIQAEEETRKQAEEVARLQAEEHARMQAEETARKEAERLEGERLLNIELESVLKAEEERIAVEMEKAISEVSEGASSPADGNSIDWEHVDNVIDQDDVSQPSNQDLNDSVNSADLYASDLSASIEGAALAGAALNEEADEVNNMTDSLAGLTPYLEDPSVVEWGNAVTRLMEMGFSDVPAIVKACQSQGCSPDEYETHLQAIVDQMLNSL